MIGHGRLFDLALIYLFLNVTKEAEVSASLVTLRLDRSEVASEASYPPSNRLFCC
jgi:hypothetical protein